MRLLSLSLRGFRNHQLTQLSLEEGINCFHGANAQGKTSLLEAISVISTGKSFRTHHLKELISHNHSHFFLDAQFEREGLLHRIKFSFDGKDKRIEYNGKEYPNFHPLLGNLPLILISPEDIELINGGPQQRRKLLDLTVAQIDKHYLFELTRFHKAMRQRNALLKSKEFSLLGVWEEIMTESAEYLFHQRERALLELSAEAEIWFTSLNNPKGQLSIKYLPNPQIKKQKKTYKEALLELFSEGRDKEAILGQTLHGPHRDDIGFFLEGKEASSFASEGQKRMILIALKFAQWSFLKKHLEVPPLLAFDDFGVHLDNQRKQWALSTSFDLKQVFITCPNPLLESQKVHLFSVHSGLVKCPLQLH